MSEGYKRRIPWLGFLISRFPARTETFIVRELVGLRREGLPLRILSLHQPEELLVEPELDELRDCLDYAPPAPAEVANINEWWAGIVVDHFAGAGVCHLHSHFAWGATKVAQMVSKRAGLPYSFTAHAGDIFAAGAEPMLRRFAAGARFVLTCTQYNRDTVSAMVASIPEPPPVFCFYHGLPECWFETRPVFLRSTVPLIISVGRLVVTKGHHILIEALGRLKTSGRLVKCTIVGEGPEAPKLRAMVRDRGLDGVIEFQAGLSQQQVRRLYEEAWAAIHAGIVGEDGDRDGIPNSLLEAMASRLPVISSSLESNRELLEPDAGILVPPGDPDALSQAIVHLIDSPETGARIASSAAQRVRDRFSLKVNSRQLAQFWMERLPIS